MRSAVYVVLTLIVAGLFPVAKYWVMRQRAIAAFRKAYARSGKDMLIVYSDSAQWKVYVETNWLPRWNDRAVVFNRSAAWTWKMPEVQIWRALAGQAEHTPVVIVVQPHRRPKVVRFWRAFRDRKFGNSTRLTQAEERLQKILGASTPGQG